MKGSGFLLPSPLFRYKSFSWLLAKDTVNTVVLCMTLLSGLGFCSVSRMIWPLAVVFPLFLSHPWLLDLFAELFQCT